MRFIHAVRHRIVADHRFAGRAWDVLTVQNSPISADKTAYEVTQFKSDSWRKPQIWVSSSQTSLTTSAREEVYACYLKNTTSRRLSTRTLTPSLRHASSQSSCSREKTPSSSKISWRTQNKTLRSLASSIQVRAQTVRRAWPSWDVASISKWPHTSPFCRLFNTSRTVTVTKSSPITICVPLRRLKVIARASTRQPMDTITKTRFNYNLQNQTESLSQPKTSCQIGLRASHVPRLIKPVFSKTFTSNKHRSIHFNSISSPVLPLSENASFTKRSHVKLEGWTILQLEQWLLWRVSIRWRSVDRFFDHRLTRNVPLKVKRRPPAVS